MEVNYRDELAKLSKKELIEHAEMMASNW